MSLFFNPTPTSNNLPGATSKLINQPNISGSNIMQSNIANSSEVIGDEYDLIQSGGKTSKKSKTVKTSKPKSKSKTVKTSKPKSKSKTVKTSKPKSKSKIVKTSKPVKKQIDLYKKSQLERLAKKHKISLKKRDGTPKTKLQLFRSLKRKELL
jgi:hypothetical protein